MEPVPQSLRMNHILQVNLFLDLAPFLEGNQVLATRTKHRCGGILPNLALRHLSKLCFGGDVWHEETYC